MKKTFIIIVMVLSFNMQMMAQETPSPKIIFEETFFHFDTIIQGSDGGGMFSNSSMKVMLHCLSHQHFHPADVSFQITKNYVEDQWCCNRASGRQKAIKIQVVIIF